MGLELLDYLPILIFFAIALVMGAGFLIAAWVVAPKSPDKEKVSAYECGFNAFDDARMKFDVRFYLVSILFIIFDLEVAFLFPWAITLGGMDPALGQFAFWSMMAFLGVLTVGFIYEWKKGALEWE
ncbi:NADH-quinone oxidoreductase subunit A [Vitreimonas flagellata]|uniref:NADH-quinone oxidoreductase subunit A n=1 Tax=Vitreimonas flagellata TaxID=2560861 RepID=UPI0010756639|nr:NADH-quinone oxidoreductase subunit A [Vitreimonas flagellata]